MSEQFWIGVAVGVAGTIVALIAWFMWGEWRVG